MSGLPFNRDRLENHPDHHLHNEEEALLGARPTSTADNGTPADRDQAYSGPFIPSQPSNYTDSAYDRVGTGTDQQQYGASPGPQNDTVHGRYAGIGVGRQYDPYATTNVPRTTGRGGVSVGDQNDLPLGQADMGDKIIGKTQKIIGKMTGNPEMHEKGELRESGGKAAARGDARSPHD